MWAQQCPSAEAPILHDAIASCDTDSTTRSNWQPMQGHGVCTDPLCQNLSDGRAALRRRARWSRTFVQRSGEQNRQSGRAPAMLRER